MVQIENVGRHVNSFISIVQIENVGDHSHVPYFISIIQRKENVADDLYFMSLDAEIENQGVSSRQLCSIFDHESQATLTELVLGRVTLPN